MERFYIQQVFLISQEHHSQKENNMVSALKKMVDHPVLHVLQNAATHLPLAKRLQSARSTTGAMNNPELMTDWAKRVFDAATANQLPIRGANLVEIGVGHSLGVAATLLALGADSVTAIDIEAYANPEDVDQFLPIFQQGKTVGLLDAQTQVSLPKIKQGLHYSIVEPEGGWTLESNSIDLVYSYFSGEHWRSVESVLAETHRVLKPGGLSIHAIDLRDHYHFNGNWLQFLYYEPWLWEQMSSQRGGWSNRLLSPCWRDRFQKNFDILTFEETRKEISPDFNSTKLATPFREYDMKTLSVSHLWVVARKPAA